MVFENIIDSIFGNELLHHDASDLILSISKSHTHRHLTQFADPSNPNATGAMDPNAGASPDANAPNGTTYNKEQLQGLTHWPTCHEKTDDASGQRLCAFGFVARNKIFTNKCATEPAPNGVNGRAWCYVQPQVAGQNSGEKTWGFIAPKPDYAHTFQAR